MKNLLNKVYNLKRGSSMVIGALALMISVTSTTMCFGFGFYEPEIPKSLYMNEE
ncbi:cyclic lactone autoinducer peptide [Hathewaya massiliensis]|uniref:cyclic lactone autoinducer peptide n=1 Tax=Hathewaya massiliensis TaxID=1964382 RepID=UPI00163BE3C1|nr:cyclic lactone autoinducer peptide [Hathewaya massiliensis]